MRNLKLNFLFKKKRVNNSSRQIFKILNVELQNWF